MRVGGEGGGDRGSEHTLALGFVLDSLPPFPSAGLYKSFTHPSPPPTGTGLYESITLLLTLNPPLPVWHSPSP